MSFKKTLSSILTGIALLTTPEINCGSNIRPSVTTRSTQVHKEDEICKSIEEVLIRDFLRAYLAKVTPQSSNFKALEKKYGKEGLLEKYVALHELCLQTAVIAQAKELKEDDYKRLGRQIAEKENKISAGISPVNNFDPKLLEDYTSGAKLEVGLYTRLLKAGKKLSIPISKTKEGHREHVKALVREAYSRKEYEEYIKEFTDGTDRFWIDACATINIVIRELFAKGEIDRIAKVTREAYEANIPLFFLESSTKPKN